MPERKLILPPSLNKLMRKSFLPLFISVNDLLLQSFHWNPPSDGIKCDLVHLIFGTAHISALLSLLLCSLLSLWLSHFSTVHFLLLSPLHFFKVMLLHTSFIPPKMSPFISTCFLNFYRLICANMYYLLKKFLSQWLTKLPPQIL